MDDRLWKTIVYGVFIVNTLGIMILMEMVFFNFPYISLFLMIFAGTLYWNRSLFYRNKRKGFGRIA